MPTWGELDQQFRELAPALRRFRIDYQWGGIDVVELCGVGFEPERQRFEALARIAGQKLSEVPPQEINQAVLARTDPRERWYEALRWHSEMFRERGGGQSKIDGVPQPPTYSGSVDNPANASATLTLHCLAVGPPPIPPPRRFQWLNTWRKGVVAAVVFLAALVALVIGLWQGVRWVRNTSEAASPVAQVALPPPSSSVQVNPTDGRGAIVRDDERAWIATLELTPRSVSVDSERLIAIQFELNIKNEGKSPAQEVSISYKAIVDAYPDPADIQQLQDMACAKAPKVFAEGALRQTLMPGEPFTNPLHLTISEQTVLRGINYRRSVDHGASPANKASFFIVGCIDYLLNGTTNQHGQTTFFYHISKSRTRDENASLMFDFPFGKELAAKQLWAYKVSAGNVAR